MLALSAPALTTTPNSIPVAATTTLPLTAQAAKISPDNKPATRLLDNKQDQKSTSTEKLAGNAVPVLSMPGLSHELRNPLAGLVGSLEVMKEIVEKVLKPLSDSPENKNADSKNSSTETTNNLSALNTELGTVIQSIHVFIEEATKILDAAKAKAKNTEEEDTKTEITTDAAIEDAEAAKRMVATQCAELCSQASGLWHRLRTHGNVLNNADEEAEKFLDGINFCVKHLASLIYPFLSQAVQAKQELEVKPEPVTAVIKGICYIYAAQARKNGLAINFNLATELNEFLIRDALPLRLILINLITNALNFTSQGSVTISLEQVGTSDLRVTVTDTGPGMSLETVTRILEGDAYHQGDSPRRTGTGTGLGLYLSKGLIENRLGGTLNLTSTSSGSTFTFLIAARNLIKELAEKARPQEKKSSSAQEKLPPRSASPIKMDEEKTVLYPQLRGKRALIAEDSAINQGVLRRILGAVGITCEFASHGQEAINKWNECKGNNPYDVILMDICMPVMDGLVATRSIRTSDRSIPIIGLSGNGLTQDRAAALNAGMNGYLTKPFVKEDIYRTISGLLPARTPVSTASSSVLSSINSSSATASTTPLVGLMSPLSLMARSPLQPTETTLVAVPEKPVDKRRTALFDYDGCFFARSSTLNRSTSQLREAVLVSSVVNHSSNNNPPQFTLG